jgi:hypothetical protein
MGHMALLDATGDLDVPWTNPAVNSTVYAVAAQADNNLVLGGVFTSVNATGRQRLARVSDAGVLDVAYAASGVNDIIFAIKILASGEHMIGGDFTTVGGNTCHRLARVTAATGAWDPTFVDPVINGEVYAIVEDTINAPTLNFVFAGGNFTSAQATARYRIACFTDLGALDGFAAPTCFAGGQVNALAQDANGDILAGGTFTSYNGTTQHYISRLEGSGGSRGLLDASFGDANVGTGGVSTISIQASDGMIIIGGAFVAVQTVPRGHVARLTTTGGLNTVSSGTQNVPYLYTDITWIQVA